MGDGLNGRWPKVRHTQRDNLDKIFPYPKSNLMWLLSEEELIIVVKKDATWI